MSTTFTRRLLARPALRNALESTIPARSSTPRFLLARRSITASAPNSDSKKNIASSLFNRSSSAHQSREGQGSAMGNLTKMLGPTMQAGEGESSLTSLKNDLLGRSAMEESEPYHFHIFSHRHNTHITVTKPSRDAIISLSCGNIGFKKGRRKQYDAAYQLTVYVLERLYDEGWDRKIDRMEVIMRGFGAGREAASKVLLGTEGSRLKDKIVRVADATRIKFGGTKSKNPRRV